MDCPICCEPYNSDTRKPYCLPCGHTMCGLCTARQSLCPECRRRFTTAELRVVFNMIPETNPPEEDHRVKFAAEKAVENVTGRLEKAKSRMNELRSTREKVRFQNADVKANISKALDLALDQLTKLRSQLISDLESSESANSDTMKQMEVDLLAQMKTLGVAEGRLQAKGRTMDDVSAVVQELTGVESPREVTFVGYTAKGEFGTELLQKAAELRNGVTAMQVVTSTPVPPPKKAAFANKYVPVSEAPVLPRPTYQSAPAMYQAPQSRSQPQRSAVPRWFYEYKGAKKAFTPDFSAALERALQSHQGWCELRDKQHKLIFEVNLHSCMSFRPGVPQHGCPVSREV